MVRSHCLTFQFQCDRSSSIDYIDLFSGKIVWLAKKAIALGTDLEGLAFPLYHRQLEISVVMMFLKDCDAIT